MCATLGQLPPSFVFFQTGRNAKIDLLARLLAVYQTLEHLAVKDPKNLGSLWIPGSCSKNAFNEEFQERFAPFSHVVHEFKKAQIEREFFL